MMATAVVKSDSQVQEDGLRELRWDARASETEVGVEVDDGAVALGHIAIDTAFGRQIP